MVAKMKTIRSFSGAVVLGTAGLLGASLAQAGDLSYSVSVNERDFVSAAKVRQLHQRIRRTAAKVCPSYFVSRSLAESSQCRREVEADLVARIGHPALTAYVSGGEKLQVAEQVLQRGNADPS